MRGGIAVTHENQSYLRFSLEESVWFQKGQEVEELYSISLEPNVTLTEDEHYVYIRGTLDLSGEYKNDQDIEDEEFTNIFLPKSVQNVERHPNGINEFVHRFPVDITIPSSRISSLDDIEVSIQTFDYAIPERNSLKLQADLIISGIYSENYDDFSENEDEEEWNEDSAIVDENRIDDAEPVEVEISEVFNPLDELVEKAEKLADELDKELERESVAERAEPLIAKQISEVEDAEALVEEKEDEAIESEAKGESLVETIAAAPPIPDFQPIFRQSEEKEEDALFEPFIVEAKRTPEIEEEESIFVSKKRDVPQLDISASKNQADDVPQLDILGTKDQTKDRPQFDTPVSRDKAEETPLFDIPVSNNLVEEQAKPIEREETIINEQEEQAPVVAKNKEKIEKEREEIGLLQLVQKSRRPATEIREQKQEAKQEQSEAKGKANESISIADFFSRKQEDEHVRVKVCIVQKGETIDDLAERYSLSVQSILQSNELQPNQDIYEGQVLYIRQSHTFKN